MAWAVQLRDQGAGADAGLRPLPLGLPGQRDPIVSAARAARGTEGAGSRLLHARPHRSPRSVDAPAAGCRFARRGGRDAGALRASRSRGVSARAHRRQPGGCPAQDQGCGDLADPRGARPVGGRRPRPSLPGVRRPAGRGRHLSHRRHGDVRRHGRAAARSTSGRAPGADQRAGLLPHQAGHRRKPERAGSRRPGGGRRGEATDPGPLGSLRRERGEPRPPLRVPRPTRWS